MPGTIDDNRLNMVTTPAPALRSSSAGFTLLELMMALAVLGVLLAIAAPSFREAAMNVRISGVANDLLADLALARSEAVKRNQGVLLCASSNQATCSGDSWAQGWIVFADANGNNALDADERPLKARGALGESTTLASQGHLLSGSVPYVPYFPSGISTPSGVNFALCDSRTTPNGGRNISINRTGRASVIRGTCPMTPALES